MRLSATITVVIGLSSCDSQSDLPAASHSAETLQKAEGSVQQRESSVERLRSEALDSINDKNAVLEERIRAVRYLTGDGWDSEILERLYHYLRIVPSSRKQENYVVINEVMEVLWQRDLDPNNFTTQMIALLTDESVDPVVRDYAIQHVSLWIAPRGLDLPSERDEERAQQSFLEVLETLRDSKNREMDFLGTGLTALAVTRRSGRFADQPELTAQLDKFVMEVAAGEHPTSPINRLTSLQVAAQLKLPQISDICREIIRDELVSDDGPLGGDLQLSAVAALGLSGDPSDRELLRRVQSLIPNLSYAAGAAIERLDQ